MTKLTWTPWGSKIAIGVYAPSKAEGERIFNICYNFGAISKDANLHVMKNDKNGFFGFFQTTWDDLIKVKDVARMAALLPRTQKQINSIREDFLGECEF